MSGGHWDCYPYHEEVEKIFDYEDVIKSMVEYCRQENKQEIADELERFWLYLRSSKSSLKVKFERIRDLLRGVDRVASCDSSWESVEKNFKETEKKNPADEYKQTHATLSQEELYFLNQEKGERVK